MKIPSLLSAPLRLCGYLLLLLTAHGASITHTFLNPDGTGFTNVVLFRAKADRAVLVGSSLTPYVDTKVTCATNGGLVATLRAGDYLVHVGATRPFAIQVPDSTNSYDLAALITGTNILSTSGISTVSTVGDATATGGGKVKTDVTTADPVVYLSSTVDDLLAANAEESAAAIGALGAEQTVALENAVSDLEAVDTGLAEDLAAQAASFAAATALKLDITGGAATNLTTPTVAAASNDVVSLRAAWKLAGDARYWGVKADGVTDDTAALTAAMAAATNVLLPDGVLIINGDTIPIGDNFQLRASAPGKATIKRTTIGSAALTAPENRGATNVVIEGVNFVGPGWNTSDSVVNSGIKLATNSTYGAVIRDCKFQGLVAGVRSQRGNTNLTVMLCTGRANSFALVLAYAPTGGKFIGNTVDGDRTGVGDGIRGWTGIWLADPGDGAGPGEANIITANRISRLRNEGIICSQAYSLVENNIVSDCTDGNDGTYGIIVETTAPPATGQFGLGAGNWVSVQKNQVYSCDGGIRVSLDPANPALATPQNVFVTGNLVANCYGANTKGISIGLSGAGTNYYTYRANVSGNWIYGGAASGNSDGIYLLNVQQGSVTGNHIYSPKRYGVLLDSLAAGTTNQVAGVSVKSNDIHDPQSAGVYLYPRVPGAIVNCSVEENTVTWSVPRSAYGIQVDNGVTNGLVGGAFVGNIILGDPSYNAGIVVNGSGLMAAANVGSVIYGKIIDQNGPTTWASNGAINDVNGRKIFFDTAAPSSTAQAHNVGDLCYNTAPTNGGPAAWMCITAGTPGSSAGVWADISIAGLQTLLAAKLDKTGGTIAGNLTLSGALIVTNTATLQNNTTVGGTLGVGGIFSVTNDVYIPNAKNFRSYSSGGVARNLLGIDGNNFVVLGDPSSSRLYLKPGSGGMYLGAVGESADIYVSRVGVANSGAPLRNSQAVSFLTSYWNGSSEVQVDNTIRALAVNTSGKTGIQISSGSTVVAYLYSDGTVSIPGSLSAPAIDAGGAGFTGSGAGLNSLSANSVTTGTLAAARGGTGTGTILPGEILYCYATNTWSRLAPGTNGQFLKIVGGYPAWSN